MCDGDQNQDQHAEGQHDGNLETEDQVLAHHIPSSVFSCAHLARRKRVLCHRVGENI
jgi:hypothetical protein